MRSSNPGTSCQASASKVPLTPLIALTGARLALGRPRGCPRAGGFATAYGARMPVPPLGDLLASLRVVAIPMRVPFRGVTTREVALVEGPAGGASSARSSSTRRRRRRGGSPRPSSRRGAVARPAARLCPSTRPSRRWGRSGRRGAGAVPRVHHGQGQGRRARAVAGRRRRPGRGRARGRWAGTAGCGSTPTGPGRSTTPRRAGRPGAHDLEYAEQPCATVEELRDLRIALARNGIDVPIAADESIRKAEDPLRVRDLEAADVVVVKVAPLGGVRAALAVVEDCGLPAVVSSALDTSVGISAGVALAAALPALTTPAGWARSPCSRATSPATRSSRAAGRWPWAGRRRRRPARPLGRTPDRVAWWRERVDDLPRAPAPGRR